MLICWVLSYNFCVKFAKVEAHLLDTLSSSAQSAASTTTDALWPGLSVLCFGSKRCSCFLLINTLEADNNRESHLLWTFWRCYVGPPESFVTIRGWFLQVMGTECLCLSVHLTGSGLHLHLCSLNLLFACFIRLWLRHPLSCLFRLGFGWLWTQ